MTTERTTRPEPSLSEGTVPPKNERKKSEREASLRFWFLLALLFTARLALAWLLPLTGDEAYYVLWGKNPAAGYYDQPPMIGWWLAALLSISDEPWVLRLPAVFLGPLLAIGGLALLNALRTQGRHPAPPPAPPPANRDRQAKLPEGRSALQGRPPRLPIQLLSAGNSRSRESALLLILLPSNALPVFMTTDTPLIAFCFAAMACLALAVARNRTGLAGLGGLLVGAGFLSKYFAVLVPLAFGLFVFTHKTPGRHLRKLLALGLGMLPALLFHLHWNYRHCWINFLFNLSSRNAGEDFALWKPLAFLGFQAYLIGPPLGWALARSGARIRAVLRQDTPRLLLFFFVVPVLAFGLSSLRYAQGLHWTFAFYPALALFAGYALARGTMREAIRQTGWLTGIQLGAAIALLAVPLHQVEQASPLARWIPDRKAVALFKNMKAIARPLAELAADHQLATDGYTLAALLGHATRRPVSVLGQAGKFGRQDDFLTDFRLLDGQKIAYFSRGKPNAADLGQFFSSGETRTYEVDGIPYHVFLGQGFNYEAYRKRHLEAIRSRYYQIPEWLPTGGCAFLDRYFPSQFPPP